MGRKHARRRACLGKNTRNATGNEGRFRQRKRPLTSAQSRKALMGIFRRRCDGAAYTSTLLTPISIVTSRLKMTNGEL